MDGGGQDLICVGDTGTNKKLQRMCSVSLARFWEAHVEHAQNTSDGGWRSGAGY